MPEGHTIHRLAKLHTRILKGRTLAVSSPQGRFTDGAQQVDCHRLLSILAHGKHLFYRFDNKLAVHVHLGLHGAFRTLPMPALGEPLPEARGQVRMRLVGGTRIVELTGPTACEVFDEKAVSKLRDRLGPDLLDPHADAEIVWKRVSRSKSSIGGLLMDQSVMSGIGNVFRAEMLYRQRLHPLIPGSSLNRETFDRLWTDGVMLLNRAVKSGYIVTVESDDIGKPLSKATRNDRFLIYRRPLCRRCGAAVQQFILAGRDCFFCPKEQRLPRGMTQSKVQISPVEPRRPRTHSRNHGDVGK